MFSSVINIALFNFEKIDYNYKDFLKLWTTLKDGWKFLS